MIETTWKGESHQSNNGLPQKNCVVNADLVQEHEQKSGIACLLMLKYLRKLVWNKSE